MTGLPTECRVVSLPPFTAVTSGADTSFDFSPEGKLGKFDAWFSTQKPSPRDSFMPRDFLFFNSEKGGVEWWWGLAGDMPDGGFEKVSFTGGWFLTYQYRDGDDAERARQHEAALAHIAESSVLEMDEYPGHYAMGHIITPAELIKAQGYSVMEVFIPVRLRNSEKENA